MRAIGNLLTQNPDIQQASYLGEKGAAQLRRAGRTDIGPGASLDMAQKMEKEGKDRETIYSATGRYHDADGKWKWMLPDNYASLNKDAFDIRQGRVGEPIYSPLDHTKIGNIKDADTLSLKTDQPLKLPQVFNHPDLYAAYPKLKDATVLPMGRGTAIASYDEQTNTVRLSGNRSEQDVASSLVHELQHGVQHIEGFGVGGAAEGFYPKGFIDRYLQTEQAAAAASKKLDAAGYDGFAVRQGLEMNANGDAAEFPGLMKHYNAEIAKVPPELLKPVQDVIAELNSVKKIEDDAFQSYQNLSGEVGARAAQYQYEHPDSRNQLPTTLPGVPPADQQIVMFDDSYKGMRPGVRYQQVEHDPFSAPAEAGTPMKLTPVEDDPHKFDAEDPQYYQRNFERNSQWVRPGDHNYNTQLNPQEEEQFRQWMKDNKIPFQADEKVTDYDMRGFYKALQAGDPTAVQAVDPNDNRMHFPDKWKTPYAATFSDQSQWADPSKAPGWQDDQYVGKDGTVYYDDKTGHWVGPDAPWSPSPGATPLELHPTDENPYQPQVQPQPTQQPLPVVPAQPTAALSPSGPDPGDADLKWSWGNEYAAPAPNNPAEPQNIALNVMQPQDYPNYAQAY